VREWLKDRRGVGGFEIALPEPATRQAILDAYAKAISETPGPRAGSCLPNWTIAPAAEIGTQWRPYVRAGDRFLSKDSFRARAGFQGSPAGIAPFRVTSLLDQTLAEVSPASAFGKATISVCASTMTAISGASPPIMAARSNCVRR